MKKKTNKKATALAALAISILLLAIWNYHKDIILNEQLIFYITPDSYPNIKSNNVFYPNQTKDFYFNCSSNTPVPKAKRWILRFTGTAYTNNPGHMKISIDDSDSKRFRTFTFKNYRYIYGIPFNKHSQLLPQKVRVRFEFTGNNSEPLFELLMPTLVSEGAHGVPLGDRTIYPFSMIGYFISGKCNPSKPKLLANF